jgi:hypothetical protein
VLRRAVPAAVESVAAVDLRAVYCGNVLGRRLMEERRMGIDARRLLIRVEMRLGQMYGKEIVAEDTQSDVLEKAKTDIWMIGLFEAWKQIRALLETGKIA